MTSTKDIFLYLAMFFAAWIFGSAIVGNQLFEKYFPYTIPLSALPFIAVTIICRRLKRAKRFSGYLASDFKDLNYEIVEERPLTFKESFEELEITDHLQHHIIPVIVQNKNLAQRHFKVKDQNGYYFELIVTIKQTWRNKFKYRIVSTSRIRK